MTEKSISSIIANWTDEFHFTLLENDSLCIALFSIEGGLLFANKSIRSLFETSSREFVTRTTGFKFQITSLNYKKIYNLVRRQA